MTLDPRFCDNDTRVQNREELDAAVAEAFLKYTREELEVKLRETAIAYGGINSVETFSKHSQLRRRTVTLEDGQKAKLPARPFIHSFDDPDAEFAKVPALGEHSETIRAEFG